MSLDMARKLACDYLRFTGSHILAQAILDSLMRCAARLPLEQLQSLCVSLGVPERTSYRGPLRPEQSARLQDLRAWLVKRRADGGIP